MELSTFFAVELVGVAELVGVDERLHEQANTEQNRKPTVKQRRRDMTISLGLNLRKELRLRSS